MRIAITGTSGMVGYDLCQVLGEKHEVWGVGRNRPEYVAQNRWRDLDITDADAAQNIISGINPDLLIHSAALSNPDDCEADPEAGYRANAIGTRNLAISCQRFDTEMMFISTDQVFGGKKDSPYIETDPTDPVNHYGRSKVWAEDFMRTLLRRFYVVRTALVFGARRPSYVDRVARCALENETLTAATDIVNSPTYSRDLAEAIAILIEKHAYGTLHIVNEGHCNRYELASFVAKTLGKKNTFIKKGSGKDLKLKAKRPGYTPLANFVWNLNGFPKIRTWQEALADHLSKNHALIKN